MPDQLPRLCIFGDSHYACLKQAEAQGWPSLPAGRSSTGAMFGGRFLYLEARDGAIHPKDDFTARRFARFNEKGRPSCRRPISTYAIFVMGART